MYRWTNNAPLSPRLLSIARRDKDDPASMPGKRLSSVLQASSTGDHIRELYPEQMWAVPQHGC